MVEAALSMLILFALIGAIVDFGLALREYNLLSYTAGTAAREISARLGTAQPINYCNIISGYLSRLDVLNRKVKWKACVVGVGDDLGANINKCPDNPAAGSLVSLWLSGEMPTHCYILCRFMPKQITSTVTAAIDNANVRCLGGVGF